MTFDPVLPWWVVGVFGVVLCAGPLVALLVSQVKRDWVGVGLRSAVGLALIVVVLNPRTVREQIEPRADVAVVITDKSESQKAAGRDGAAQEISHALVDRLSALKGLDVREVMVESRSAADKGTQLLKAAAQAVRSVEEGRLAGVVMITDGQVHDGEKTESLVAATEAPVHVVLTGVQDERDRRVLFSQTPTYALVGQEATATFRVDDTVKTPVAVTLKIDGKVHNQLTVMPGKDINFSFAPVHAGRVVVEVTAAAASDEVSTLNNRAVAVVQAVRDRLNVLLVSGQPHAGGRTWRNLLKSDPAVELVHFTILRPPEKDDFTPIEELALIHFPTRELFEKRLADFDLVVLDRYLTRNILVPQYYANLVRYVQGGGALLAALGPEFSGPRSIARTALGRVLPVRPLGPVVEEKFRPKVTALGKIHPVMQPLASAEGQATWGHWYRRNQVDQARGHQLMSDGRDAPLLILDRVGKGRVGVLTSDHVWLWARGHDGGGPHGALLRRLAHWLMQEPELEEESLRATADAKAIRIERRSLKDDVGTVTMTTPSGQTETIALGKGRSGMAVASVDAEELGVYEFDDGIRQTLVAVGAANPLELADLRATASVLRPLVDATGGAVHWVGKDATSVDALPAIRRVRPGRDRAGRGWIGFVGNEAVVVTGIKDSPWIPLPLLFGMVALLAMAAWWREGR